MECHWAGATDLPFQKSNQRPDPKAPKIEPTLPRWDEWKKRHTEPPQEAETTQENRIFEIINALATRVQNQ